MEIDELHNHILKYVQGGFSEDDMRVLREEIEKLKPGDIYVEIGVDEGRSARVAHEYAHPDVFKLWIDIHDPVPHEKSIGRAPWFEQEGMVGLGKKGFYVHGDADEYVRMNLPYINLLFIDGHHDYDSVKKNTLSWERLIPKGGVILFHDYDHPESKIWLDKHFKEKEVLHGKIVRVRK